MKKIYLFLVFILANLLLSCGTTKVSNTNTNTVYEEDISIHLQKYPNIPKPEPILIDSKNTTNHTNTQNLPNTTKQVATNKTTGVFVAPSQTNNLAMDSLLTALYDFSKNIKSVQGYRILVYSGSDREEAQKIENDIERNLQERAEMSYDKPNFRVRVGSFIQRLEAYKTYKKLQKAYPNAIIVLDKINIDARRKR
jgi:hypothetical protein